VGGSNLAATYIVEAIMIIAAKASKRNMMIKGIKAAINRQMVLT
jgi:hypothetical protein